MSGRTGDPHLVVGSRRVYDGRIVSLRVDSVSAEAGIVTEREVVEHRGAVGIVPMLDAETIVMVTQYRHAVGEWLLEVPAGTIEQGEDPEWCAARELEEETGFVSSRLRRLLTMYVSPGYCNETIHVFVAEELRQGTVNRDADEEITVEFVRLADVPGMIADGRIRDAKTIAGLLAVAAGR